MSPLLLNRQRPLNIKGSVRVHQMDLFNPHNNTGRYKSFYKCGN